MKRPTLLIVEDDADLAIELGDYLAGAGYRVRCVASMHEAEVALQQPYDLLLLDINLPDGSGFDLCRRLRPYLRAGIVMCTGRSERKLRIDSLRGGADAYLVKPVDPEELEATLASVLRRVASAEFSPVRAEALPAVWRVDRTRLLLLAPNGTAVELSAGETLLLERVLSAAEQRATRTVLMESFSWGDAAADSHRLEAMVSRLRRKVQERTGLSLPLNSIYGKGYHFSEHGELI
jgi:DNA-binding response OmpR family regulator